MVIDKKLCFIFLIETLCMHKPMEKIRSLLGFEGLFVVNPVGRSGGLAILWKRKNSLEIFNYSRFHINAVISEEDAARAGSLRVSMETLMLPREAPPGTS